MKVLLWGLNPCLSYTMTVPNTTQPSQKQYDKHVNRPYGEQQKCTLCNRIRLELKLY